MTCLRWHGRWNYSSNAFETSALIREWVVSTTSRSRYPRGKPVPIVQETTHTVSTCTKFHDWAWCWTSSHDLLFSSPVAVTSSLMLSFNQHLYCVRIACASVWSMFQSTHFSCPWPRFLNFFFFCLLLFGYVVVSLSSPFSPPPNSSRFIFFRLSASFIFHLWREWHFRTNSRKQKTA